MRQFYVTYAQGQIGQALYDQFKDMSALCIRGNIEYKQVGHEKAKYASVTLKTLDRYLINQYGAGFSRNNISRMR